MKSFGSLLLFGTDPITFFNALVWIEVPLLTMSLIVSVKFLGSFKTDQINLGETGDTSPFGPINRFANSAKPVSDSKDLDRFMSTPKYVMRDK